MCGCVAIFRLLNLCVVQMSSSLCSRKRSSRPTCLFGFSTHKHNISLHSRRLVLPGEDQNEAYTWLVAQFAPKDNDKVCRATAHCYDAQALLRRTRRRRPRRA